MLIRKRRQHIFGDSAGKREKNQSAPMAGKIPKPGDIDAENIKRPNFEQLSAEDQKALNEVKKKIREEKEEEIRRQEEEATKHYMSYFSIDRQGRVTKDKDIVFPSTPTTDASAKVTAPVSATSTGVTLEQVENLLSERDVRLVNLISAKSRIAAGKQLEITDDTSPVSIVVPAEIPVSQSSTMLPVSQ